MSYQIPQHCPQQPSSIDNHPKTYDLDITKYSFEEILGIFHLSATMSLSDLKRARKRVLMTHPDKSNLPPDYYIFYKKAFDIVVAYYSYTHQVEESAKKMEDGAHTQFAYSAQQDNTEEDDHHIKSTIQNLSNNGGGGHFNAEFNRLFDKHVKPTVDDSKNEWFRSNDPVLSAEGKVTQANMGTVFEHLKKQQQEQGLIRYNGVRDMRPTIGTSLYGEDEEDTDEMQDETPAPSTMNDPLQDLEDSLEDQLESQTEKNLKNKIEELATGKLISPLVD